MFQFFNAENVHVFEACFHLRKMQLLYICVVLIYRSVYISLMVSLSKDSRETVDNTIC